MSRPVRRARAPRLHPPAPVRRGELHDQLVGMLGGALTRDAAARELSALTRQHGQDEVRWMLDVIAQDVEAAASASRKVALCW